MELLVHQQDERKMLVTLHTPLEHLVMTYAAAPHSTVSLVRDGLLFKKVSQGITNTTEVEYPLDIYVSDKQARRLGEKILLAAQEEHHKDKASGKYMKQMGAPLIHWYMMSKGRKGD